MIVVQTPLRISFLGGGTDFQDFYQDHGGAVLSTAVDKYIFVIVKERFDDLICVNYSERERVESVADLRHELVREAMKLVGVDKGVEITTLADVPSQGTGLGSSSSVTVGLLHALHALKGDLVSASTLAEEACNIEIDILRKPIGRQDQYIAAYGNMRFINFNHAGVSVERVELVPQGKRRLSECLLLFYTGVTRNSSDILSEQKSAINAKLETLSGLAALASEGKDALLRNRLDDFGDLLHRGWEMKKTLTGKISNAFIDEIYGRARAAGAGGGKLLGAGGGGFLLLYCPLEKQKAVRQAVKLRELPFRFEGDGSKVIFSYRRSLSD